MKQTSFLHQCLSLAGGTLVVMFISALTMPVITRLADPSVYGQVTIFNTWCSLAVMVCSLGLDQTFIRFFYTGKTPAIQRRILSFCLAVPLLLCLLLSCALLPVLIGEQSRFLVLCFILALFVRTLNRMGMLVLRLKYRTSLYSAMSVLNKSLYVILVLAGMRLFSGHSLTVMIGASLAAMTACVAAELYAERTFWFKTRPAPAQSIKPRHLLAYGLPLMAACAVFLVFQATDRFCIRWFADYNQVGVYASAQSIMNLFAVITSTFQTLWLPRAIEHYERDPQDRTLYRDMNRIMTVVMFLFGAVVLLLKDVFVLFLGESYRQAAGVLPFLLFTPIMSTVSETTVIGLAVTRHSAGHLWIMGTVTVFNVAGNLLLVPVMGIQGAAVATGISYILYFWLRTAVTARYFRVGYPLKRFSLLTAWFALTCWYHLHHSFSVMTILLFLLTVALTLGLYPDTTRQILRQIRKLLTGPVNLSVGKRIGKEDCRSCEVSPG